MKVFVFFLVLIGLILISTESIFAEPISYEDFMKTYQPILDRVYDAKLSPHKQIDIGLLMRDVVCFDNMVQVLQFSSQSYVACVNPETAPILVQRGWGVVMYDETKYSDGHGYECSLDWVIYYDNTIPKTSELIYHLRSALKDIQESLLWTPIIIEEHTKSIIMHSGGNYSQDEIEKITKSLRLVSGVESVGIKYGACI